jgi:hypothetical protein
MTQPWSNDQVEAQITKLKLVKRQMYGRAKLDLLQAGLIGRHKNKHDQSAFDWGSDAYPMTATTLERRTSAPRRRRCSSRPSSSAENNTSRDRKKLNRSDLGDACLIGPRGVPGKKMLRQAEKNTPKDSDAGSTKKASRQRHVVRYCTAMQEHYSLCGSARNSALCRAVSRVSLSPVVRPGAEWPPEEISRGFAIQRRKATGIGTTES